MRDFAVVLLLVVCVIYAWKSAWFGVLGLAVFSYLSPHGYAWGFSRSLPLYQTLLLVSFLSYFKEKHKQSLPNDWRIKIFYTLWLFFLVTTLNSLVPDSAWSKLIMVSKTFIPLILVLLLIDSRMKLYYLIIAIALSVGLVALKGGIFAVMHGFSYRIYGPEGTPYYENNAFAVITVMVIPLLVLWMRETQNKFLKYAVMGSIPFCMASALSSWSRGGLLTLAATTMILLWHSKRKYLAVPLLIIGIYVGMGMLPQEWFNRMHTIETYKEDGSAQGRLQAWGDGYRFAIGHPILGGGFDSWKYITMRDWHSSYIEIMAEHGLIAFGLWISMIIGTLVSLTRLPRLVKGIHEMAWVKNYCYMIRASVIAYMIGTIFLGMTYWDIIYNIIFISVLVKKFVLKELSDINLAKKLQSNKNTNLQS
ncbi:MAG: putative O-glycosylation ligase, exosortase A system-associated [Maribacter sp.]|nr:putative O-glycosylation ligase, exosortase A system-associated [Maribacter sp.]